MNPCEDRAPSAEGVRQAGDERAPMATEALVYAVESGVAWLRLNRPEVGNAFDLTMARAFRAAVDDIARQPELTAVVLAAEGKLFCAGGDVASMAAADDRPRYLSELAGTVHAGLVALRELPLPIVAAVQGAAAGAGLGLVLSADIAIAAYPARFVSAYADMGLSPDGGVSALLPAAIGPRRAARFMLTGMAIDATTARDWGLVTQTCSRAELSAEVAGVILELAARPHQAVGATARLLRQGPERGYAGQLALEARTIADLAGQPEAEARIGKFADRTAGAGK